MFGPVREGMFYYSRQDYERGVGVKVWFQGEGIKRGWQCTTWKDGRAVGLTYPLSPDIWDYLYSEEELSAGFGAMRREYAREHSGYTK